MMTCDHIGCRRSFISERALTDHAAAVHFSEIRSLVEGALHDSCADDCYIVDMTSDYVVYEAYVEGRGYVLFKADYSIADDNSVEIGESVAVLRTVTYTPDPRGAGLTPGDSEDENDDMPMA